MTEQEGPRQEPQEPILLNVDVVREQLDRQGFLRFEEDTPLGVQVTVRKEDGSFEDRPLGVVRLQIPVEATEQSGRTENLTLFPSSKDMRHVSKRMIHGSRRLVQQHKATDEPEHDIGIDLTNMGLVELSGVLTRFGRDMRESFFQAHPKLLSSHGIAQADVVSLTYIARTTTPLRPKNE